MRVTQKDIARRLGVSPSLVSRVLNGTADEIGANTDTIARIRREAASRGYTPSATARRLKGAGPLLIGIVASDLDDPFFGPATAEVVRQSHHAGYALTLAGFERRTANPSDVAALLEQDPNALIILGGGANEWVKPFVERNIPVIRIGAGEGAPRVAEVRVDEERGFELLIEHLTQKGHRSFAFIGAKQGVHARRLRIVRTLLARRGLSLSSKCALLPEPDVLEAGLRGGEQLARLPSTLWPTAVLCSSDAVALGALRGVASGGWRVPHHVSITGFDDLALARLANPPLTSVRQPIAAMVADALRLVSETRRARAARPHAPELIVRASTDFPWRS